LRQQLAAVGQLRGYMVEHDAYQHFEHRYRLQHKIALTDNSDLPPTPAQIVRAKNLLDSGSVSCVWREQQESRLMKTLLAGRKVKLEVIDALAINQPASQEGLLLFYRSLGRSVLNCLRY
jgi:zinc transport system substrate-binding protein